MTNTKRLEEIIEACGLKKSYIAKMIGVSIRALSMKIRNKTEFKASEIEALCQILSITDLAEKEAVFFAREVD